MSELAWQSGMTKRALSRRCKESSISVISASIAMPRCPRTAPLGLPVVPEVYMRHQGSSAVTSTAGSEEAPPERRVS